MKRQKTMASICQSRNRNRENNCRFETLEARQLLAFVAFESITGTLDIIYESGETLVTVGNNNQYLTINGVEAEAWNSQFKRIRVAQIENMVVSGNASTTSSPVSLKFVNKFNEVNAPLFQTLNISDVNDIYFAGQIVLGSDLTIATYSEPLSISQSMDSALTNHGETHIRFGNGSIDLSHGLNDFVGPVSIKASPTSDQVLIADSNSLKLGNIDIAGKFRITAESVSSSLGSVIAVNDAMYVNAGSITLGNHPLDHFAAAKLNFKSTGIVNISADSNLFLIGANSAESASLQSTGWIRDAGGARTNITDQLELRAAHHITLGEQDADEFNTGVLLIKAAGPVSITEDSSTNLFGVVVNGSLTVYSNMEITVFGENTAGDLTLHAGGGLLSDVAGSQTIVQNHTTLSGSTITWGKESTFMTNTLTLKSDGNVTVRESNDLILTGTNVANSFRLLSPGAISNTPNTSLAATYRLDLAAASTDLGNQVGDNFQFSSLRFNTTGAMNLHADCSIRFVLDNHARSLNLQSTGNIGDQPGSSVLIEQAAHLSGVDIVLGDIASECFKVLSNIVVVSASGISDITLGC